jgi:predicted nucleic acid-binding protein
MNVYLDTSVILRVLFRESGPLKEWGDWDKAYASRLWYTEALRVVDRVRLASAIGDSEVARLRNEIDVIHQTLHVCSLSEAILTRAGEAFPTVIGTLDAIHLATALFVQRTVILNAFLTHDQQLATAAAAVGFKTYGT